MEKRVIVVSHTHWDREWYMPFQEYRIWLVEFIDNLIEVLNNKPDFKCFTLDGQTSIIEDYLEVRPENFATLKEFIAKGKIVIGPWYTQPDEWLVSPEALVRNLLIGHRVASRFGNVAKIGYVPDNFGHPIQLPQILNGFDIDNFIFMRGMGDEGDTLKTEFIWQAPNGSKVIAVHLIDSYVNAAWLGIPQAYQENFLKIWEGPCGFLTYPREFGDVLDSFNSKTLIERVRQLTESLSSKATSDTLLFMNGCDHAPAQPGIVEAIKYYNKQNSGIKLIQGSLEDYITVLRPMKSKMQSYAQEFWGARYHYLLSGVLSTRIYLKQQNRQAEVLLESYAEPLASFAALYGYKYPEKLLSLAWKLLLLNQAHDSIHGSSVDSVHVEMEARYNQIIQIANAITYDALRYIAKNVENHSGTDALRVIVYNPVNWIRSDVVKLWANIPPGRYFAKDIKGKSTPIQFLKEKAAHFPKEPLSYITFLACDVPPNGYKEFILEEDSETKLKKTQFEVKVTPLSLENEFFYIKISPEEGGSLTITDKRNNVTYKGFNTFIDEGDHGDVWDYSPPKNGNSIISSANVNAHVEIVEDGPVVGTLMVELILDIPKRAEGDKRSNETTSIPIKSYVSLYSGVPRIDIKTLVDNKAEDHRLRVAFNTGIKASTVNADGLFYVNQRPVENPAKGENWKQPPPSIFPQELWLEVHDEEKGVTIANKGLPEYECRKEKDGVVVYITLLRCVGSLSKDDLVTRKGHAGPPLSVPGAQCIRQHIFEYSIIPHMGNWAESRSFRQAECFINPLTSWNIRGKGGSISCEDSFIKIAPENVLLTAIKKAEDDNSTIIRFYEIMGKACSAKIEMKKNFREAWISNMNEESKWRIEINDGKLEIPVSAYEIVTLRLKP